MPCLGLSALFAARGLAVLLGLLPSARALRVGVVVTLAALLVLQYRQLSRALQPDNTQQLEVLARLARLTAPDDVVYDNSGGYVARPHAHFYFYTDAFIRTAEADLLAREVPRALMETGCVARLEDVRSDSLPPALQRFLAEHYQPLDGDISLWGQRLTAPESRFLAVREDEYFVWPEEALAEGELLIDGVPIREPVFSLKKGPHRVEYRGTARELFLLWLPANGERWHPRPGLPPRFSRLF